MWFYWIVLGILIVRVITMANTWLFDNGSMLVTGHLIAESIILIGYIKLFKQVKS